MKQIGIGMILVGLAGLLGITGKMIYEEYGIEELIVAICGIIIIIWIALTLIAVGQ